MRTRLRHIWEVATSGYWFVPTLMSLAAVALAFVLLYIDRHALLLRGKSGWLYTGGPDGAQTLLSTIAGSVATVAGVAFSITIAAISQASSQFGPRLLRNFMRDTGNQIVLGTFVATFLYCLLVLRTAHAEHDGQPAFVPHLSVAVSVVMAAASMAVLIYFIHHVSVSLQAPAVVAASAADLQRVIQQLSDDMTTAAVSADGNGLPPSFDADARRVASTKDGYVQAVDYHGLVVLAEAKDLIVRLECRPGDHLMEGRPLASVWPSDRFDGQLCQQLNAAFMCGRRSTPEQDVEYAVRQMVEIAVRALSPGINDPFTAINCVDALGSGVCRVAKAGLPGPNHHDRHGKLRIVARATTFTGVADMAFNQIRQYGRTSAAVTIRLLAVLAECAEQMRTDEQRRCLLRHAEMVYADAQESITSKGDREAVRARWEAAAAALGPDRHRNDVSHPAVHGR